MQFLAEIVSVKFVKEEAEETNAFHLLLFAYTLSIMQERLQHHGVVFKLPEVKYCYQQACSAGPTSLRQHTLKTI